MRYIVYTWLFAIMGILHAVAGVAFWIDGDNLAASVQLGGGAFWMVLAMLAEKTYN